jgi:hypothetical protein
MTLCKAFYGSLLTLLTVGPLASAQSNLTTVQTLSFKQRLLDRSHVTSQSADLVKERLMERRYQEDLLAEKTIENARIPVNQKSTPAFADPEGTLINPKFSKVTYQSGDVLVLRGNSTISTSIAKMSDSESQFSHTLIVHVDPKTQKSYAIEALIDQGVIVHPLEEVLNEGVHRVALYRHDNSAVARDAAQIAYDKATSAIAKGKNYPYDFKLDMNDSSSVYCAELIRMAYSEATKGALKIPTFPSTLGKKFSETLKSVGYPPMVKSIYAPSDMDVEPSFQLVAEWRDAKATLNYRIKDQIMSKLFQWVEEGTTGINLTAAVKAAVGTSQDKKAMDPAKLAQYAKQADDVVNQLSIEVLKVNDKHVQKTGYNMSAKELAQYLESVRHSPKVEAILKSAGFASKAIAAAATAAPAAPAAAR